MKPEFASETEFLAAIERRREAERTIRNENLRARLAARRTFEELFAELSSLEGFNQKERLAFSA